MSEKNPATRLKHILTALDSSNYFNGGQTVVDKYPLGSAERDRLIHEAEFWRKMARDEADEKNRT